MHSHKCVKEIYELKSCQTVCAISQTQILLPNEKSFILCQFLIKCHVPQCDGIHLLFPPFSQTRSRSYWPSFGHPPNMLTRSQIDVSEWMLRKSTKKSTIPKKPASLKEFHIFATKSIKILIWNCIWEKTWFCSYALNYVLCNFNVDIALI